MKTAALLLALALLTSTLAAQPNAAVQRAANGGIIANGAAANLTNNGTITNSGAITNGEGGTVDLSQGTVIYLPDGIAGALGAETSPVSLATSYLELQSGGLYLDAGDLYVGTGGIYAWWLSAGSNYGSSVTLGGGTEVDIQGPLQVYESAQFDGPVRFLDGLTSPWQVEDGGTAMTVIGNNAFLVAHSTNGGAPRFGNVTVGTGLAWGTVSDGAGGQKPTTIQIANTTITPGTLGNATATGQFTVNAQGQLTGGVNVPIQLALAQVTNLTASLSALAPLASPALTGLPTAPTQGNSTNNTTVATTGFVKTAIGNIVPAFTTITVGGNSVTANSTDTLYFVAGTNIAITVNNTTKTVTINATASPSTNLVSGGTHNGGIAGFVSGSNTTLFSSNSTLDQGGNMTVAGGLTVQGYTTFNGDFGQVGNIDGTPNFSAGATTSDGGTVAGMLDAATTGGQVIVSTGTGNPYQIDTSGVIIDSDYWGARLTAPGTFDAGGPNWGEPAGQGGFHVDGDLGAVTMYNDGSIMGQLYLPNLPARNGWSSGTQGILVLNSDGSVGIAHFADISGY